MPSTVAEGVVHVAVGILVDRDQVFLTRRRADVHQAGKWEFPGGKLHAGEETFAALRRELHEELGIDVQQARPFMQVRHAYPDKRVLLDVWSVDTYSGTPHGREGQETRWVTRAELLSLDLPEADHPIQRRLWLPALYAISDYAGLGRAAFFDGLTRALASGLTLLQLREPNMTESEYRALAHEVVSLCHSHGAKVLLNADPSLVVACGADGVHLNSDRLRRSVQRPLLNPYFVAASCHNDFELKQAENIDADLVVLGPVAPTPTHPSALPLGWDNFETLCRSAVPAVYALGGMRATDVNVARLRGAHGVAMLSALWRSPEEVAKMAAYEQGQG